MDIATLHDEPRMILDMILLTGATGVIGSALLRAPARAGRRGSLSSCGIRGAWARTGSGSRSRWGTWRTPSRCARPCGVCAPSSTWPPPIRDQRGATIEELNGLATARLLRYAEAAGVERFVYFGAMGATPSSRTRFFRAKALAERAVADVADRRHRAVPLDRLRPRRPVHVAAAPALPAARGCRSREPAARATSRCGPRTRPSAPSTRCAAAPRTAPAGSSWPGPEVLSYEEIVRLALTAWDRPRPLVHVPLWAVRRGLRLVERLAGHVGVRHLGGGRADGGAHDDAARDATMPAARRHAAADGAGAGTRPGLPGQPLAAASAA